MNCRTLVELVTDYLEDAMDERTRARFEDHLRECDNCQVYLDQMRLTLQITGSIAPDTLDPQARDRLLVAFRSWSARRTS